MKILRILAPAVVALAVLWVSQPADAAYRRNQDVDIHVNVAPSLIKTDDTTGNITFQLQERLHQEITDATGLEIDHFYGNFYVNGSRVAAVDPFCIYEFDRGGTKN